MASSRSHFFRKALRHPIMILVVLVVLNRYLKNEYPFNSFPMYAEPGGPSNYFIISDVANDTPIPVRPLTGFSSSDVKKMYIERRNRECDKLDMEPVDAPPHLKKKVVKNVIKKLRKAAAKRENTLPDTIRLTVVEIIRDGKTFREDPAVLGEG